MYYEHEYNHKAAAQHTKSQMTNARDRLKANAAWKKANKTKTK